MAEKRSHEELSESGRKAAEADPTEAKRRDSGQSLGGTGSGERRGMSREEAGRLGGEKLAEGRGPEYFRKIGQKVGETVAEERGREFYSEIGKMGSRAEPREAKVRGGEHSHMRSERSSSGSVGETVREKRAHAEATKDKRKSGGRSGRGKD